jgi:hypothetical protein
LDWPTLIFNLHMAITYDLFLFRTLYGAIGFSNVALFR